MPADWTACLPMLEGIEPPAIAVLRQATRPFSCAAGTRLFGEGEPCENFLFVLEGSVRVQKVGETGREIVLYRVGEGESCVMTTVCLMTGTPYDAEGIAESPLRARLLPMSAFRALLASSAGFRDFVFRSYGIRLSGLLMLIEEVAFGRIDQRLAACLLERAGTAGELAATHHDLAVELGSAREVISRQLKEFERRGWLRLARGSIALADPAALARLAKKDPVL